MRYLNELKLKGLTVDELTDTELIADIKGVESLNQELSDLEKEYETTQDAELLEEINEIKTDIKDIDDSLSEFIASLPAKQPPVVAETKPKEEEEPEKKKSGIGGFLAFVGLGILTAGAYWLYSKDKEN